MLDTLVRRPAPAKASTGIGAFWMSNDPPISIFTKNPQEAMREAQLVGVSNRWIRAAERVIAQRFSTVPYHLEDGEDNEIGDDSPENLRTIRNLIERPYTPAPDDPLNSSPRTRAGLWQVTCRHMGLCGNAFWYLDQTEALAGTPLQILYINPLRMQPKEDKQGNLLGWLLDGDAWGGGALLERKQVIQFVLEPPDVGHLGVGLVESAMAVVGIGNSADRHAQGVLTAGGRSVGVYAPKGEQAMPPDVFEQLKRDVRTIADLGDSSRRNLILSGPVEYTRTSLTPLELELVSILNMSRDEVYELWNVPRTSVGGVVPQGIGGDSKDADEAVLWQNAVGPRLRSFAETVQYELLDRYKALGVTVELEIQEPEFDDETPAYTRAQSALSLPMRNSERRALVGLQPFGDPSLDDAVWMPAGIVAVGPDSPGALIEQAKGNLITIDEARARMNLGPISYDETPTPAELIEQVKGGLLSVDEARSTIGRPPMVWDTTPDTDELVKQLGSGLLTIDEARQVMGLGPMEWGEGLSHDEIGALIAEVEAGVITHDEAREKLGLAPMQWSEDLSKDEVDMLNAQLGSGLLTIEEARIELGRSPIEWPEDLDDKIKQASALIRAGFDPADVMRTLGLPPIRHLGRPPITVQKVTDAEPLLDASAKARADLRTASSRVTPKMQKAVAAFLAEQKRELVSRIRAKSDHLAKKQGDTSVWWDGDKWDKRLTEVLTPYAKEIASMTADQVEAMLGKADR